MVDSKVMQSGRYKAYPKYKDSGVEWIGEIPSGWELTRIKYVSKCLDGARIPLNASERGEMSGNVPYWGANKVVDHINDYLFNEELVLLGEDGAPFFDKNKDVAFNVSGKIWPNNHVHVLRPLMEKVEPRFLKHSLNCADFYLYISGSTRDKLNQSDMNEIFIRAPKLIEQKQIANFLDYETAKIDSLIEKQQRLIELLTEKRQAVISHAVTKGLNPDAPMKDSGVEWLGEVPEHWDVSSLRWFIDIASGKGLSSEELNKEKSESHPIPAVGGNGVMGFTNKVNTKDKALAIGRVGALCGNVHLIDYNAWITDNALKISRWRGFSQEYLAKLLEAANLNELASKTAQPLITGEQVKSLIIVIPPLSEQKEIASFIDKMHVQFNLLTQKAQQAIQLMQERRTALISAAVTGKIDVRDWVKPE